MLQHINNNALTQRGKADSVRTRTNDVVNRVATVNGERRDETWSRIYQRLEALYGIDIESLPRSKNESLLMVAERLDLIDKVYSLAYAEYLYTLSIEE